MVSVQAFAGALQVYTDRRPARRPCILEALKSALQQLGKCHRVFRGCWCKEGKIPHANPHTACAQVDLRTASLRPGRDGAWLGRLTERLMAQVGASRADITVHCSTWQHDLDQVGAPVLGACRGA